VDQTLFYTTIFMGMILKCEHISSFHGSSAGSREQEPSQDCILIFPQADAPDGILEMAVGSLPASLRWQ